MTAAPQSTTVRSDDLAVGEHTLRVHRAGSEDAPALVLLHGSGPGATAWSNWGHVLEDLGRNFYCIAPDILGFGDSSHPADPPVGTGPFGRLRAQAILDLLDQLGLDKVSLLGNSMGGMISLRLLEVAPERFSRVVLMASGGAPLPPTQDLLKLVLFYEDPTEQAMAELMSCFVSDPAVLGGRLSAIAAERMPMALRDDVRRSHQATFTYVEDPLVNADALGSVRQPVLLLNGREDRMIPLEGAYWLLDKLPEAQLHVLPHCGHWVQVEQRERFVELVTAFVSGAW